MVNKRNKEVKQNYLQQARDNDELVKNGNHKKYKNRGGVEKTRIPIIFTRLIFENTKSLEAFASKYYGNPVCVFVILWISGP